MAAFVFHFLCKRAAYKNVGLPVLSGTASVFFNIFITELHFEFSNYTQVGYVTEITLLAAFRTRPLKNIYFTLALFASYFTVITQILCVRT